MSRVASEFDGLYCRTLSKWMNLFCQKYFPWENRDPTGPWSFHAELVFRHMGKSGDHERIRCAIILHFEARKVCLWFERVFLKLTFLTNLPWFFTETTANRFMVHWDVVQRCSPGRRNLRRCRSSWKLVLMANAFRYAGWLFAAVIPCEREEGVNVG